MEANSIILTKRLVKAFKMGQQKVVAINGLEIQIQRGSFTAIMGPSGSGKSTLLYLLGGLDRPTSGSIVVGESALDQMDENELAAYRRQKVGFIFQSFNLVQSMTALENVEFPMWFSGTQPKYRRQRARELLKQVGLEDRLLHRPTELSGGQQQRVAIARALVNDPALILADEPTGNLDTQSGQNIMLLLSELHRNGKTILVVSHDTRMLRYATDVIYILDGRAVSEAEYRATSELSM
ncbi:MAG: ABC transporter ATP-binding protein [Anaerolineae bacterium]|nr:ABC transporter ATP-binding protein [Anaerolineae bacterium]